MKYFFSLILLFFTLYASGQKDTVKVKFRSLRVGVDAYGIIKSAVTPNLNQLEITGDVDLTKFIVSLDLGRLSQTLDSLPRFRYSTKGTFFKVGFHSNLLKKDEEGNIISVGLVYGRARFNDQIEYDYTDPILGSYSFQDNNTDGSARWLEASIGMRAAVWKNIWLGYKASYKFGLKTKFSEFEPFLVPGYGPSETNTDSNSYWGFNYYIMIGIGGKK